MPPPRTAIIEEFDDDTDLPLPSRALPNTGTHGPLLEEISADDLGGRVEDDDDDDYDLDENFTPSLHKHTPGSASHPNPILRPPGAGIRPDGAATVTDVTPYKSWTCLYPIYIDAKRPYGTGERRVARAKSIWWPLSKDIAEATSRLGLGTLHEVNKTHPRDWENPGRVRVQWRKDGQFMNSAIRTKKQLLEMVAFQIQLQKPDNVPRPPYKLPPTGPTETTSATPKPTKGKQPAPKPKQPAAVPPKPSGRRLPIPPDPQPSLSARLSAYSPAISSGVLIETLKAGMNAQEGAPGAAPGAPGVGGIGKGKRKVVRVRG